MQMVSRLATSSTGRPSPSIRFGRLATTQEIQQLTPIIAEEYPDLEINPQLVYVHNNAHACYTIEGGRFYLALRRDCHHAQKIVYQLGKPQEIFMLLRNIHMMLSRGQSSPLRADTTIDYRLVNNNRDALIHLFMRPGAS